MLFWIQVIQTSSYEEMLLLQLGRTQLNLKNSHWKPKFLLGFCAFSLANWGREAEEPTPAFWGTVKVKGELHDQLQIQHNILKTK